MVVSKHAVAILAGLIVSGSVSLGADRARVLDGPQLERPTLHSLGVYWIVARRRQPQCLGSAGVPQSGCVDSAFGAPLVRVERGRTDSERFGSRIKVPDDGWLFAGSVLLLEPGTAYELRLTLDDPDGSTAQWHGGKGEGPRIC